MVHRGEKKEIEGHVLIGLMGNSADTLFKGVYTGSQGDCCRKSVPLYDGMGYEALLYVLLAFKGDVECH